MSYFDGHTIWVEKYRPRTVAECILPNDILKKFQRFVDEGDFPNLMLTGSSGTGKTTIAKAMCEEMDIDYLFINASEENGIDVLRTRIRDFATSMSEGGKIKAVIFDEADYLNATSVQPALRGFIEEFSSHCRFIFTCNYPNRLLSAIHSRSAQVEFKISQDERPKISMKFMKRILQILEAEGVEVSDNKVVAELINMYFPDFRKVLNRLQYESKENGKIDEGILARMSDAPMEELIAALKAKNFKKMREWVATAGEMSASVYRKFYDHLLDEVKDPAQLVLVLADYQSKSAWVVDQEINTVACLTEIMATATFK